MATTITANGINFPDGSAGSPSIGGTDTNTGLFTGSDIVGFATGGSERLRIDASGNVNIANDSGKLQLGTSEDLRLYHDGSNSFVLNQTGKLFLRSDTRIVLQDSGGNESFAEFIDNGAVELYYNGSKKLETTNTGAQLFGNLTVGTDGGSIFLSNPDGFSPRLQENAGSLEFYTNNSLRMSLGHGGNLLFQDNRKAEFGSNSDLQIYHDASHAKIKNATGHIVISSNSLDITNAADNENLAKFDHDGAVNLYYNGTKKFETRSNGVHADNRIIVGDSMNDRGFFAGDSGSVALGSMGDLPVFFRTNSVSRWKLTEAGHFIPHNNNTYDLGTSSDRIRNVYTNDLHLSNEGGANDVDGTWGSYTIQEGAEDLFLINKRNGKKYKFNLTEVS